VVILKPLCTKEQFMEALDMMDPADIEKLEQRKGVYTVIVTKFDLWIKCLLNSKKQVYLSKLLSTKKTQRSKRDYEDQFINKEDAKSVEDLIKQSPYYKNGKFFPLYGNKSAIVKAFYILEEMGIIAVSNMKEDARTFCMHFGANDLSDNTLRKEPKLFQEGNEFKDLFSGLK